MYTHLILLDYSPKNGYDGVFCYDYFTIIKNLILKETNGLFLM